MKNYIKFFGMLLMIAVIQSGAYAENHPTVKPGDDVVVYYFHATKRCVTCKAVEAVTKEALKEYYGEKVVLTSINREKDKKNPLLKKYKVNGQTLLVVKGDDVVNLTSDAFLNARTKPEKLKKKIKTTIDSMLK